MLLSGGHTLKYFKRKPLRREPEVHSEQEDEENEEAEAAEHPSPPFISVETPESAAKPQSSSERTTQRLQTIDEVAGVGIDKSWRGRTDYPGSGPAAESAFELKTAQEFARDTSTEVPRLKEYLPAWPLEEIVLRYRPFLYTAPERVRSHLTAIDSKGMQQTVRESAVDSFMALLFRSP